MEYIQNWDEWFLRHAYLTARKSKDKSTKVGSVLVRDKEIICHSYNGFCRGVNDDVKERWVKPLKLSYVCHSEFNIITNAARNGIKTLNTRLYTLGYPCENCAKSIIQGGISEIIYHYLWTEYQVSVAQDWAESIKIAETMLNETRIKVTPFTNKLDETALINGKIIKL